MHGRSMKEPKGLDELQRETLSTITVVYENKSIYHVSRLNSFPNE
jgi:hypothetical protein